jgi:preprotein translocase subunit SecY
VAYLWGGAFGPADSMTTEAKVLIFLQLFIAGQLINLMDEILQKGWGLGSGISLFIAAGVAGQVFWNALAYVPMTGDGNDGLERGIIIAFFSLLFKPDYTHATTGQPMKVWNLFIRDAMAPSILGLITTIIIFLAVIYVESMRVDIPLQYAGHKGYKAKYPMKLLYVSNIPVILAQAVYANALFFGQLIAGPSSTVRIDHPNWEGFLNLIGRFDDGGQGYLQPIGGLVYYLTPPQGLSHLLTYEGESNVWLHAIIYLFIFIWLCVKLGQLWVEVSGLGPREIARQIISSKMQIPGFRSSEKIIAKVLERYIPKLTVVCGFIVGILSFGADFLGALSSGTGLLLAVGIIHNYAETISKEAAAEQYPAMRAFLGLE